MNEAWIIDACRTPRGIGKPGKGALSDIHPQHLGATVLKALTERNDFDTAEVGDIVWGTSSQRGVQGGDLGRMAALDAGYDVKSSAMTLDRFCGTGITTVNIAAANIMSGMEDMCVAGGTEMMSLYGSEGFKGSPFLDNGNTRLRAEHPQPHQGVALTPLQRWKALTAKRLTIWSKSANSALKTPLKTPFRQSAGAGSPRRRFAGSGQGRVSAPANHTRRFARPRPSFAKLADFPLDEEGTTFRKLVNQAYPDLEINHVHHAGNSSGVVDGAAALLLTSDDYAKAHGMKPRARVVAMANMGDSPTLMLNAPVPLPKRFWTRPA